MTPDNAIEHERAEYRLLDHNDEIRESDQFDDDGEWASIAQRNARDTAASNGAEDVQHPQLRRLGLEARKAIVRRF